MDLPIENGNCRGNNALSPYRGFGRLSHLNVLRPRESMRNYRGLKCDNGPAGLESRSHLIVYVKCRMQPAHTFPFYD
ncbi:MAG: hypothetical protein JWO59_3067 [Chloroflexi bacterium]|nr:hypothetical protein [Chloroflexota bacterium]